MKFKRISLISVCLVIFSLILLLPFNIKNVNSYADFVDVNDVIESKYLVDNSSGEEQVFLSNLNEAAGTVYGYGKFNLGESTTIVAEAQSGFKLVGFEINYLEQDRANEFLSINTALNTKVDDNGYTYFEKNLQDKNATEILVSAKFLDSNQDNYFDKGEFNVSRVFENIEVNAVFDYIYSNVNVTSFINLTDVKTAYSSTNYNGATIYYYNDGATAGGQYNNAILNKDENFYYLGTIYAEGESFYTLHVKPTEGGAQTKVDISNGVFRQDETVTFNFNILTLNDDGALDIYNSKNIDLLAVNLIADKTTKLAKTSELENNSFVVTADETKRTTNFAVKFDITLVKNYEIAVGLEYDNLYVANLNFVFDDDVADEEETALALKNLTVSNYVYKFENKHLGKYFVKTVDDNNQFFRVVANAQINETIDRKMYNYYNFVSLDGYVSNAKSYTSINDNFDITIKYASVKYTVNFEFRLFLDNTLLTSPNNFKVLDSITLTRGQTSAPYSATDAPANVGYTFLGYTENLNATQIDDFVKDNFTTSIAKQTPSNKTVYLVYELINYTVKLTGINSKKLNNGEDIYPISNISANQNGQNLTVENNVKENEIVLTSNLQISNSFGFSVTLNNGFKIVKARILNGEDIDFEQLTYSFKFDEKFIALTSDNVLTINLTEDYVTYELRYFIEKKDDPFQFDKVVMANISVDKLLTDVNVEEHKNEYPDRDEIIISNLKLYDVIRLYAVSNINQDGEGNYYHYAFNLFTQNDKTGLTVLTEDSNLEGEGSDGILKYYNVYTVGQINLPVKVVYSMQEALLIVQSNMDAYTFFDEDDNSTIRVEGATSSSLDRNNSIKVTDGDIITISINSSYISFGYKLAKFVYNDRDYPAINGESVTIEIESSQENIRYLYAYFEEIEYKVEVYQTGTPNLDGTDASRVNFGGEEQYLKSITISKRELKFDMPEGYYVGKLYFIKGEEQVENSAINSQNNDYFENYFAYSFTDDDIVNLLLFYGEETDGQFVTKILISYNVHTFSIRVNYGLTNPKGNDYDNFIVYPSINLTYTFNGQNVNFNSNNTRATITFYDIPYGATNATLTVNTNELPVGYAVSAGFTNLAGTRPSFARIDSLNSITLAEIKTNYEFNYKVEYVVYSINLVYSSLEGTPSLYVNNRLKNTISIYDSILLDSNGNRLSGFMFDNLYYFAVAQGEDLQGEVYVYDADTHSFNLNDGEILPSLTYYKKIIFSGNNRFTVNEFNPTNFAIINNEIYIYLNYTLIKIWVENVAENTNYSLDIGDIQLSANDYSDYTIYLLNEAGERTGSLQPGQNLNYYSIVEIEIRLRTLDLDNNPLTTYNNFDLYNGVNLLYIFGMNQRQYSFIKTGNNVYRSENIRVSELMNYIQDDCVLTFNYMYSVDRKSLSLTTNITNEIFYNNKFNMELSAVPGADFNVDSKTAEGKTLASEQYFLTYIRLRCSFKDVSLYNNFNINKIDVRIGGQLIDADDWARYGISSEYVPYSSSEGVNRSNHGLYIYVRFIVNSNITIQIRPIIRGLKENENTVFVKPFDCDEFGNGIAQTISIGKIGTNADIEMDDLFFVGEECVAKLIFEDEPINKGVYSARLKFETDGDFAWLEDIVWPYTIYLQIESKRIEIRAAVNSHLPDKTYDGTDDYLDVDGLMRFLQISPLNTSLSNVQIRINYATLQAKISSNQASSSPYDIVISGLSLTSSYANNGNFNLTNSEVSLRSCIRIVQKTIRLRNLQAYDKLYDGTNTAFVNTDNLSFGELDVITQNNRTDDVYVDTNKLKFVYEGNAQTAAQIGTNKSIILADYNILAGRDSANYVIDVAAPITLRAGIYPAKVEKRIDGVGTITVFNKLGETDLTKASLIPTDANGTVPELSVEIVAFESAKYAQMYSTIVRNIINNTEFKIGYILGFKIGDLFIQINNELFLSLPNQDKLVGGFYLKDTSTGRINYDIEGDNIIIDLSQLEMGVNTFYFTVQRTLLKWWQLLIIILLLLLLIVLFIIIIIIIKRKKERKNEMYERI